MPNLKSIGVNNHITNENLNDKRLIKLKCRRRNKQQTTRSLKSENFTFKKREQALTSPLLRVCFKQMQEQMCSYLNPGAFCLTWLNFQSKRQNVQIKTQHALALSLALRVNTFCKEPTLPAKFRWMLNWVFVPAPEICTPQSSQMVLKAKCQPYPTTKLSTRFISWTMPCK